MKGWFPFAEIKLDERMIEAVITEAKAALEPFLTVNSTIEFPVSVHIITATKV